MPIVLALFLLMYFSDFKPFEISQNIDKIPQTHTRSHHIRTYVFTDYINTYEPTSCIMYNE